MVDSPGVLFFWFTNLKPIHMSNTAIIFPGQGSQSVGMLSGLAESFEEVKQTFEEASECLGVDLWQMSQEGPAEELNKTINTQPAMLAAGIAVWRVWQKQGGVVPSSMAGHSLGEYSALVASGSLAFADGIKLVRARGEFMQAAVPAGVGAMAAILGLDDDKVRAVCASAAADEVAEAVNFNSPGQVVVAGNAAAIQRAVDLAKEAGAKRALMLDVSVPSHCSLMKGAAEQLADLLESIELQKTDISVIHNVNVAAAADAAEMKSLLAEQLFKPVRWVETIGAFADQGVDTIIEAGPGKVLSGLGKRINRSLSSLPVIDPATLEKALEAANA